MPKFEISKSGIDAIKEHINKGSDVRLRKRLKDLHYADIAEVIYELSTEQATYLVKLLDSEKTADALAEVDEDIRERILEKLSAKEVITLRDEAFDKYHNHKPFLNLIKKKFGNEAAENIVEMTKIKLKRKIKGD